MATIGTRLREERRRKGLKLSEVGSATLIPERHLAALEEDRFDLLPAGSYRRSFLREYANYLGLNGDAYADEYQDQMEPTEPLQLGPRRPGPAVRRPRRELRPGRLLAVPLAIAFVLLAVWLLGGFSSAPRTRTPPTRSVRHHHPRTRPRTPVQARHTTARPHRHPTLALTAARGPCWLLVRVGSSGGRTLYEQTLPQGQTVRFGLATKLWISIGAPSNLSIRLGGRAVSAPRSPTNALLAASSGLRPSP